MSRKILGPFNRVEGDLAVNLALDGERVSSAQVTSPMYRGFERALVGRPLADALVVVPRICGICSVSQSVAAVRLIQALTGVRHWRITVPGGLLQVDVDERTSRVWLTGPAHITGSMALEPR